ncbi:MAG: hypothetical protein HYY57_07045, partial [Candidatus Omnitrophica bacterium]|nr:hypothetical protein [Candidatus Omnitrophota bacterium]
MEQRTKRIGSPGFILKEQDPEDDKNGNDPVFSPDFQGCFHRLSYNIRLENKMLAAEFSLIRQLYSQMGKAQALVRQKLNHPLTLTEKILAAHLQNAHTQV